MKLQQQCSLHSNSISLSQVKSLRYKESRVFPTTLRINALQCNNIFTSIQKNGTRRHSIHAHKRSSSTPHHYWESESNQRSALERIGEELGVKKLEGWYNITSKQVSKKKARFIKTYYNGSLFKALTKLYPEYEWDPLQFAKLPQSYWHDIANQRNALDRIGKELGVQKMDDWYKISSKQVKETKAAFIVKYYNGSLIEALKKIYPEHNWDPLQFAKLPQSYWDDELHQKKALDRIGEELGVQKMEDWYSISSTQVRQKKASFIKKHHNGLMEALKKHYPDYNWDPLQFLNAPKGFWQKDSTKSRFHALFIKWKEQFQIKELKDWYRIPPRKLKVFQRVAQRVFGSVTLMLQQWFPDTNWSNEVQASSPELNLQWMLKLLADVKVHQKIGEFSVDVFIPQWKLAIEYQGGQHLQQSWHGDLSSQLKRDKDKQRYFQDSHISLVCVSHNWNGSWSQLRATIRQTRPDLLAIKQPNNNQLPNIFPENITLEEVTAAVKEHKFFKRIDWGSYITFDYDNTHFPMMQYKQVFQQPSVAADPHMKRLWQIFRECRGIKFAPDGALLCRPFHKFFNLNEMPEVQSSQIDMSQVECVTEKYDGRMIAPIVVDGKALFVSRGGVVDPALDRFISTTAHGAFANYVISNNKTPIFEYVSKNFQSSVVYPEKQLILLAIRDNLTGQYSSYNALKEEAAPYDIIVAKEWPIPATVDKLDVMKKDITGIEGFVLKLNDGNLVKCKTDWWREQRKETRKNVLSNLAAR